MNQMSELMRESVDYAGLFPPASLTLDTVVANYHQYVHSTEHSMLGRLIIPASRLGEYGELRKSQVSEISSPACSWRISALVPPIEDLDGQQSFQKFESAIDLIQKFNNQQNIANDVVDAIEVKTPNLAIMEATIERLPSGIQSFLEFPHSKDPGDLVHR